jgi:glycogen debranching enzyme
VTRALIRPDMLYAWKGSSLLIVNTRGECGDLGLSGYYYREARHVRTWRLDIDGESPWLCETDSVAPDIIQLAYVHPEVAEYEGGGSGQSGDQEPTNERGLPQRGLDILVTYRVGVAQLDVSTRVANRSRQVLRFDLGWTVDADFADIQEAQSGRREQEASVRVTHTATALSFEYAHDRLPYRTSLILDTGYQWTTAERRVICPLTLQARESRTITLTVRPQEGTHALDGDEVATREARLQQWRSSFARVTSPRNSVFERVLSNNVRDFASFPLLDGEPDEWLTLQAGMPLYPAFFGRDAVTAGWQAGYVDCGDALDAALTRLGRLQSHRIDDWHDEEPGRIPYQVRRGPLARLDLNPYAGYYADYASPLMFIIALANLYAWTGNADRVRRHLGTAQRILEWARTYGDADRDGYLEYRTRSSKGTKNQGWKDSGDAVVYDDGSAVPAPIATCELQGYWYAAQQLMGVLSWMLGSRGDARDHLASAADLKKRFNRDWWIADQDFFALAMDPEKRLVGARTSNVGHCLASGIIDADHLPATVGQLFAPDMFSGWGVRTLSSDHAYYSPVSYHRGTVWAVEQATILFGLRRFGFDARAHDLARGLFDLAQLYPEHRIPECIGGYARTEQPLPGAYPQANTPQLWNATAFPLLVQSLLGLLPLAPYETLLVDPSLPDWLPELVLRDLRVGGARVTLRFWRQTDGSSAFETLEKRGTLRIIRQPPPESLSAGLSDRFHGLVDTVLQ